MIADPTFAKFALATGGAVVGALGMIAKTWGDRRIPNVVAEANRVSQREKAADDAHDKLRQELRGDVDNLRKLHEKCEDDRRKAFDQYQQDRMQDRVEVAALKERVGTLREYLDIIKPSGGKSNVTPKAREKRQKAKA